MHFEPVLTQCMELAEGVTDVHELSHLVSLLVALEKMCNVECEQWRLRNKDKAQKFYINLQDKCLQFQILEEVC